MNTLYAKLWEGEGRTTTHLRNGKGTRDFDLQESQTEEHISKIFFFPGRTTNIQGALLSDGPFMVPPFWGLLSLMGGSFFPSTRFLSPSHFPSRAPLFTLSTSSHTNGNSHDTPTRHHTTPLKWGRVACLLDLHRVCLACDRGAPRASRLWVPWLSSACVFMQMKDLFFFAL